MKKIIALALLMAGVTAMEAGNRIIEENIIQTDKKNIEMEDLELTKDCLLYTSPSPRDRG